MLRANQTQAAASGLESSFSVFRCDRFDEALNVFLRDKQAASSGWSIGAWAKRLKLSSTAALVNILKGRKLPSDDLFSRIAVSMSLSEEASEYLRLLLERERRKEDPNDPLAKTLRNTLEMLRMRSITRVLELDQLKFFSDPRAYYVAEIVNLPQFREDCEWIARSLRVEITPAEVKDLIHGLLHQGILARDGSGRLFQTSKYFDSPVGIKNESAVRFHQQSLLTARDTIRAVDRARRNYTSDVIAIDPSRLPEAKAFLERLRKEFAAQFAHGPFTTAEVYQMNIQLLPVTDAQKPDALKKEENS